MKPKKQERTLVDVLFTRCAQCDGEMASLMVPGGPKLSLDLQAFLNLRSYCPACSAGFRSASFGEKTAAVARVYVTPAPEPDPKQPELPTALSAPPATPATTTTTKETKP